MTDERVVEEIVSKFLLSSCRLRPQLILTPVMAATLGPVMTSRHFTVDDAENDVVPLITGSVAEFYIEPMIPHIGDIDVMFHLSTQLAIPRGHPPPTRLPDEFHNYVKVVEIIDSHIPGYVYLEIRYLLTECLDDNKYTAVEYDERMCLSNCFYVGDEGNIHGPAFVSPGIQTNSISSGDIVRCVRCLVWPPQAVHWPTRHRNHGWPDSATVDRIVSTRCDVVGVAHRQCREHNWMGKNQWRLSFSRAEIVLINSWMPVQQIVYHLLRHFTKTEPLTGSADISKAGTLSNYHIKTLMLWACELKPRRWWTDDLNLVGICVELLHVLADWLSKPECPHYFIYKCNIIIDSSFELEMVRMRLRSINKSWLSSWFVNNYIRRCSETCPQKISRLFYDVSTTTQLQGAVSAIVDYKLNATERDIWYAFTLALNHITLIVSNESLTVRSLDCWLSEYGKVSSGKISSSLSAYILSVAFLHVACRTERSGINDELMDVLSALVGQSIGPRRYSSRRSSVLLLSKAVNLMKSVDDRSTSRSTVQLIAIELSKLYLRRSLSWEDSDSDSIFCLVNVYLAVLYYTTGQYQAAIDHCTLVMRSQNHLQCSSHVVQGEILPTSNDNVDMVLGLAAFYQHVRRTALNQHQQPQCVTVFTTELFAHYLQIKSLSVTKCQQLRDSANSQTVQSYVESITEMHQLFIADVLLWKLVNGFFVSKQPSGRCQYPTKYPSELNTSDLVQLLQKSAVEHLTTFRQMQLEAPDFLSVVTVVTTDFEAMYAYKRGDYQHCLQLSTQNVRTLMNADSTDDVFVAFPEFIQMLDHDIVSLTALTLIVNPYCRDFHPSCRGITQLTLSLYLMTQCQLKLRQSLPSLAQVLNCIVDAHRRQPINRTLDRLVLKMIAHKAMTYITTMMNKD